MKNQLKELQIFVPAEKIGAAECVREFLSRIGGCRAADIAECRKGQTTRILVYFRRSLQARQAQKKISSLKLRGVRICLRVMNVRDWRDRWKKDIKPFALTQQFIVCPLWRRAKTPLGRRKPIHLDTSLAFGTGLHETTRFMAQMIESRQGRLGSFLDVGTGTGLLAIVAALCKAKNVTALDYDPLSIAAAKKNFSKNGLAGIQLLKKDFQKFRRPRGFDFIAANLTSDDLIKFRKKLVCAIAPQGFLAVSGIVLDNLTKIKKVFRLFPLRCCKIVRGKKWAAVLYQRRA